MWYAIFLRLYICTRIDTKQVCLSLGVQQDSPAILPLALILVIVLENVVGCSAWRFIIFCQTFTERVFREPEMNHRVVVFPRKGKIELRNSLVERSIVDYTRDRTWNGLNKIYLKVSPLRTITSIVPIMINDIIVRRIKIVIFQSQYTQMRTLSPKPKRNRLIFINR